MSTEKSNKEKEKMILLIEDKLSPLLNILLSVQTMLFIANKQSLPNAPKQNNTQIQVLHLIDDDKTEDLEHFERLRRTLEEREQNENGIEKLEYRYQPLKWDASNYPEECEECATKIVDEIEKICEGKDFSIILDVILSESVDSDYLANSARKKHVLSQVLFERFRDNCIPYTNYVQGEKHIRKAWEEGVNLEYELFQRQHIVADAIYKPFRKKLYKQLRIGGETL